MKTKVFLCVLCLCTSMGAIAQSQDDIILKSEYAKRALIFWPVMLRANGGITTNISFVSFDGATLTTNSISISNGLITGWTK